MKTMKNISQDSRCAGLDSNLALPEYKSEALQLGPVCLVGKDVENTYLMVPYQFLIGGLRKTKELVSHDNESWELEC
jgi:hypothetical protein